MVISPLSTVVKKKKGRKKEGQKGRRKGEKRKKSLTFCLSLTRRRFLSSIIPKMNLVPVFIDLTVLQRSRTGIGIKKTER